MEGFDREEWKKMPRVDKARYFASQGDSNLVRSMALEGVLDELPEFEQRQIVAESFTESAKRRDRLASQGLYHKEEWKDPKLQEAGASFSSDQRARGLEILYNPEGKDLKVQLKEFSEEKQSPSPKKVSS